MSDTPKIYLPGDPRQTQFIKQLMLMTGLIQRDTTFFITARHWALISAELDAQYADCVMEGTRAAPWKTKHEFTINQMGDHKLTVINAGTDDQDEVNRKNRDTPGAVDFIQVRDHLRIV